MMKNEFEVQYEDESEPLLVKLRILKMEIWQ